jgi:hypothetical protein
VSICGRDISIHKTTLNKKKFLRDNPAMKCGDFAVEAKKRREGDETAH